MIALLFWTFFRIGVVGFGGGYAILSLIQNYCVNIHGWITTSEFIDLVTISQITPGPILLHTATFIGHKVAGLPGALVATIACIIPSLIIVTVLSLIYYKNKGLAFVQRLLSFLKPVVIGLVVSACATILVLAIFKESKIAISNLDVLAVSIMGVALLALRKFKLNPILVILSGGFVTVALYFAGSLL